MEGPAVAAVAVNPAVVPLAVEAEVNSIPPISLRLVNHTSRLNAPTCPRNRSTSSPIRIRSLTTALEKRISRSPRAWLRMSRSARKRSISGSGGGGGWVSRREIRERRVVRRGDKGAKGHSMRWAGRAERGREIDGQPSWVWGQGIGKEGQVWLWAWIEEFGSRVEQYWHCDCWAGQVSRWVWSQNGPKIGGHCLSISTLNLSRTVATNLPLMNTTNGIFVHIVPIGLFWIENTLLFATSNGFSTCAWNRFKITSSL
jgi:hypothetical protein